MNTSALDKALNSIDRLKNCGIGSGGFQPGNTCARGGGAGGSSGPSPSSGSDGQTHTVKLPKNPKKLNISTAMEAMEQMGYKFDPKKSGYDLRARTAKYAFTKPDGSEVKLTSEEVSKLVYANQAKKT